MNEWGVLKADLMMNLSSDYRWDSSVVDRHGQLTLVVEVKRKLKASPEWAAAFRHNILAHGTLPKAPYFLMVFPDQLYLWTNANADSDQSEPTYTIDARPIFQPYLERAGIIVDQISSQSLELIIGFWLREIIYSEDLPKNVAESQPWLIESGLRFSFVWRTAQ
jgi:hypothetical protein